MALPPPPPPFLPRASSRKKKKSELHPQARVSRFWSKYHCRNPGKVTSIFPRKLYKGLTPSFEKPHGDVHNAAQSYQAARAECEALVRKAVARCEQTNTRFTDFEFDIETDHTMGERHCLYGLDPPLESDSDSDDDDPTPEGAKKSCKTTMKSQILSPPAQLNPRQVQKYLGVGRDGPDLYSRRISFNPNSVHRIDWIFESPKFTINGYSSSDIKQGSIGDCWWLAAVSNIAHRRDLMDKICVARDEECGVYGFVFHRDGEWIPTVVDDNLYLRHLDFGYDNEVYDSRGKKARLWKKQRQTGSEALYFSRCEEENETWLPLLEKAYAKAHGDYDAIHGGWVGSGVEDLTGGVNNMILANRVLRKECLWREMLTIDQEKGEFVFGLSASTDFRDLAGRKNGIVQSHAYSVLWATEIEDEEGMKQRLVKMRNPWGQRADSGAGEWHGPWSDGSREWTPYMIKRLQHEPADDGVFWMSFEDVLSNFKWIHRTRLFDETWTIAQQWTSDNISWVPGYLRSKFVVQIKTAGLTVFVLSSLDERYFKGLEGRYWLFLEFIIRKPDSTEILSEAHGYRHSDRRSVNCEIYLEPGIYEVYPKVTVERHSLLEPVEKVIQREADRNPKKLRQVGMQYDIAHAKAGVLDEDAEQVRKREKVKRKIKLQKRKHDKMKEMKDAMTKMQTALSNMTKQLQTKDQNKDRPKDKERDNNDKADIEQDPGDTLTAQVKEDVILEDVKPPGFWPGDTFRTSQMSLSGDSAINESNKNDNKARSQSNQTRDAPPPKAEPEPNPMVPTPEPTPAHPQPANDNDKDSASSSGSDSDSDSESDSSSDFSSDTDSVLPEQNPYDDGKAQWNPVCVMCLRVYAQDKDVSVKVVGKKLGEGTDAEVEIAKDKDKMKLEKEEATKMNKNNEEKEISKAKIGVETMEDGKGKDEDKMEEDVTKQERNKTEELSDELKTTDRKSLIEEIKEAHDIWLKLLMASGERNGGT